MKIGKAKFGGSQKKNYWKLKDGESVYRILPPLGDLADAGKWSVFYNVHYGYKNAEGKARPFQSSLVKNRKNGMIESPDAAMERIDNLKAELEKAKASKNKAAADMLLKLVGGQKSIYNLDNNHYVNAMDMQGNIGVLKLLHRAKLALDAEIKKLRDKGIEPLSVENGRFFSFFRTGTGMDTSFQVTVKKEQKTVAGLGVVEIDIVHVMDESIISRLSSEAAELDKLFRRPTPEEVELIVKSSDLKTGIVSNIDEILGIGNSSASAAVEEVEEETEEMEEAPVSKVAVKPATSVAAPVAAAPKVEPKVTPKAAPVSSPQTTAEQVANMDVDDFLATLGLNES